MIGDISINRFEIMCEAYRVFIKAVSRNRKKNGSYGK